MVIQQREFRLTSRRIPLTTHLAEIPVKILVDNREPTPRTVWEARLRNRIDRISDILESRVWLAAERRGSRNLGFGNQTD